MTRKSGYSQMKKKKKTENCPQQIYLKRMALRMFSIQKRNDKIRNPKYHERGKKMVNKNISKYIFLLFLYVIYCISWIEENIITQSDCF